MIKILIFGILKVLLAFLLLLLALKLSLWYLQKDANEFCEKIDKNDSLENIHKKASASNYRVFERVENEETRITIPTQDSPFFRFACVVTIENNKIIGKEVIADD